MFLKTLKLTNFRNYSEQDFEFDKNMTVLVGDNAQGKSNFLESIYLLATTRSLKAEREEELIKTGEDFVRVEGVILANGVRPESDSEAANAPQNDDDETKLEIAMQNNEAGFQKKIKVNGISRRSLDYCLNLAVVLFSPEDVNLVTGSPSLRRNHIDSVISQVDKSYKKAISNYEEVVTKKNKILKRIREGLAKTDELTFWFDQQILLGQVISSKRQDFFDFLNSEEKKFGDFSYKYLESEVSAEKLIEYRDREIESATSLVGPHRDDFLFKLAEKDLAKFGSRGEQRTAVLDLKLLELNFMEGKLGSRPVLLLDDIFSELDEGHRAHVSAISKLQQTIIATVEFDQFLQDQFKEAKVVGVKNGEIVS